MDLLLQDWYMLPPEADLFWGIAAQFGFLDVDVESITTVNKMRALKNRKTYGFLVCQPNLDSSTRFNIEEGNDITVIMEEHVNMSPTVSLMNILLNSGVEIDSGLRGRFDFFRQRSPETRRIALPDAQSFKIVQNSFISPAWWDANIRTGAADYRYVAYIFKNNWIWELDGRNGYCRRIAQCFEHSWIDAMEYLFKTPQFQTHPGMTFLAVTRDYSLDISKNQSLMDAKFINPSIDARVFCQGEELEEESDLMDWLNALEDDSIALRFFYNDRILNLETFRLHRHSYTFQLHYFIGGQHYYHARQIHHASQQYLPTRRPVLRSLYAHIVPSSEELSTDQADRN